MGPKRSTKLTLVTVLFFIREVATSDHGRITVYADILPVSSPDEYSKSIVTDFWTLSIVLFYLRQSFGDWILRPSSGNKATYSGPIDIASLYLRTSKSYLLEQYLKVGPDQCLLNSRHLIIHDHLLLSIDIYVTFALPTASLRALRIDNSRP
jgi:hypothetical protein